MCHRKFHCHCRNHQLVDLTESWCPLYLPNPAGSSLLCSFSSFGSSTEFWGFWSPGLSSPSHLGPTETLKSKIRDFYFRYLITLITSVYVYVIYYKCILFIASPESRKDSFFRVLAQLEKDRHCQWGPISLTSKIFSSWSLFTRSVIGEMKKCLSCCP